MAGDLTSRLIVRLIDGVSAPAAKAATAIRQLVGVSEKVAVAGRGTGKAVARDIGMVNRGVQRITSSAAMPIGLLGALGARTVYQYQKVGNAMQAVTGITDDQRKQVEDLAVALNEKFPSTLGDIMGGAFELGRAGLDHEQILGGLEGTLQLSLAGDLAIDEAADISTNILTAMRLPAKGAEQVAASLQKVNDVLAYVATNSNTDVRMMGETLKYVGPIAAAAGMSLDEVGAASMIMAKNGIRASEAGVALRSALVRMVRPTKPMIDALGRLKDATGKGLDLKNFIKGGRQITSQDIIGSLASDGIDASGFSSQIDAVLNDPKLQKSTAAMTAAIAGIIDESGSMFDKKVLAEAITDTLTAAGSEIDFLGFMRELRERGADVSDIARIFDARQGSRLITLLAGDLDKALDEVSNKSADAAKNMAETRMKGIVGEVNKLIAAWDNLVISIAKAGVLSTVGDIFKDITKRLNELSASNPRLLEIGTYAAMATVALIPLGMAFSALGGLAGAAVGAIGLIGSAIAVLGGPATIAIGLLTALGVAIYRNWDKVKEVFSAIGSVLSSIGSAIGNGIVAFAEWGAQAILGLRDGLVSGASAVLSWVAGFGTELAGAIASAGVSLFDAGARLLQSLWEGMKSVFSGIVNWASGVPGRIGNAIKGAVGLGGGESSGGAAPPARARGGPVSRGRSYLVGEHRPEIFTPGSSGYISPRADGGGGSNGPTTITNHFVIQGVTDPEEIGRRVMEMLKRASDFALQGAQADVRTGFSY